MNCDTVTRQLPLFIYGELSFEEEESVQQHLERCSACQTELANTAALHRNLDQAAMEPNYELLTECRRNLRLALPAVAAPRPSWRQFFTWDRLRTSAGAVALIALGFFGARAFPPEAALPLAREEANPVVSRVRFVEPGEQGKVQIVLEETRQRILSGDMEDDGIRTLLLRAARESSDPGVRVGTMDLLKTQPQSEDVRLALLQALRQDSNAGVRLKALEALRPSASQPDTRRALADVLLKDENPGVRTQAIDLLTSQPEPAMVGVLQEIMSREDNSYVRMKTRRALADMNASVETF